MESPLESPRAADMRTILLAALEYATEHSEWPKTLDELKPKYVDAGNIDLGQFVYHPLSPESLDDNPQEVAVLAEKEPAIAIANGRLVGFADGFVALIRDAEQLKRLFPAAREPLPAKDRRINKCRLSLRESCVLSRSERRHCDSY